MLKGLGKHFKAPKTVNTTRWHSTLPHSLQGRKEWKMTLTAGLEVSAQAKTLGTIITHVEADVEENTPQPPTWRAKCRGILCCKNTGYHTTDPKIRT
jgi:hypothetical protein